MRVVSRVALDSVPPLRRRALEIVQQQVLPIETSAVAKTLGLPTVTTRSVLKDLAAYGLLRREVLRQGHADAWVIGELP